MRFYFIFSLLIFVKTYAQKTEKIIFQSANPFALSDIINNLENQTEQEVFGKLTFPKDSINLNKKFLWLLELLEVWVGENTTMNT